MDGAILDPQELEAIRSAIRAAGRTPQPGNSGPTDDALPIALIADDRAAERVRPSWIKVASRWAQAARVRIMRLCGAKLSIELGGIEIVEGSTLRDELPLTWMCALEPDGRPGLALLSVGGPMVEALAAALLGGGLEDNGDDRPPSATARRLFAPAGEVIGATLVDVWRDEQGCRSQLILDEARVEPLQRALTEIDVVVSVTLEVSGATRGKLRLVARPETLVQPAMPVEAVPAPPGAIEDALGQVPIELRVELGRAHLSMMELGELRPGQVLTLDRFVDDLLPVRCAGVLKAQGRALVSRGVMAVEILDPHAAGDNR